MSDDEVTIVRAADPLARVYDYFKHLGTVALISIGGVFGLLQGDGPKLSTKATIVTIAVLGASGALSLFCASYITTLELQGRVTPTVFKSLVIAQRVTTCLLMFGLGIFIGAFSKVVQ